MKRLYADILLVALTALVGRASALPVTTDKALSVAQTFWAEMTGSKSNAPFADRSAEWDYDGIYLFTQPQGGFVMVAADDAVRPILGYSTTSTIDPAHLPAPLAQWLATYQLQIEAARSVKVQACNRDAEEWQRLANGQVRPMGKDGVGPLLTTQWDQMEPYNGRCPEGAATGCAATAQAQMMKYWNFPPFGRGAYSYNAPNYGIQSADFAHTHLDWENMPDKPTENSPEVQRDAVATLMYLCGVSLEMNYNTAAAGGSSAAGLAGMPGVHSIDNSLIDYFYYSPDMQVITKNNGYTDSTWRAALIAELNQHHPIIYTGAAQQGGHGFVCDGCDSRQYLHFNFGWSGKGDGYYPVDSISPGVGGVGGNVTYTFNIFNQALVGAVPVYALRVSDSVRSFTRVGGSDSVLVGLNPEVDAAMQISCEAPWVTLGPTPDGQSGWLTFQVEPFDGSQERSATINITQGNSTARVAIVQTNYSLDEMCPLTVVMESTKYNEWRGNAHLTLESASGFVFGSAQLSGSTKDSVTIMVAPKDVYAVWHRGGGTDRYVNYYVRNQYGETCVSAVYAYNTGGTDLIPWPCAHVGIDEAERPESVKVYPNPVHTKLNILCDNLEQAEIYDMLGHLVASTTDTVINIANLRSGHYVVKLISDKGYSIKRFVKK